MKPIWFDTSITGFTGTPDLSAFGMHSATLVTSWGFFRAFGKEYDYSHVDFDTCKRVSQDQKFWAGRESDMIVLDIETFDLHTPDLPLRDTIHDQLIEAVQIYRDAHPGVAIGYYGNLPQVAFYPPLYGSDPIWAHYKPYYETWVANNKQVFSNLDDATLEKTQKGLCAAVDRVFPSCYHADKIALPMPANLKWWKAMHDGNITESLQYQKPVIAYLTPQYLGKGEYFPAGVWKEMLLHSLNNKNVDGVCVYQSVTAGTEFDPAANWWTETLEVIGK